MVPVMLTITEVDWILILCIITLGVLVLGVGRRWWP